MDGVSKPLFPNTVWRGVLVVRNCRGIGGELVLCGAVRIEAGEPAKRLVTLSASGGRLIKHKAAEPAWKEMQGSGFRV